ncbi:hypothetical protein ACIA49_01325 [Kribbella sp. NPDC051587]|uniref:hypothetical protein n=1 Tax=Kribbella sp. NPDC051587 TaxID=3364119 RepID=UPI00378AC405
MRSAVLGELGHERSQVLVMVVEQSTQVSSLPWDSIGTPDARSRVVKKFAALPGAELENLDRPPVQAAGEQLEGPRDPEGRENSRYRWRRWGEPAFASTARYPL